MPKSQPPKQSTASSRALENLSRESPWAKDFDESDLAFLNNTDRETLTTLTWESVKPSLESLLKAEASYRLKHNRHLVNEYGEIATKPASWFADTKLQGMSLGMLRATMSRAKAQSANDKLPDVEQWRRWSNLQLNDVSKRSQREGRKWEVLRRMSGRRLGRELRLKGRSDGYKYVCHRETLETDDTVGDRVGLKEGDQVEL